MRKHDLCPSIKIDLEGLKKFRLSGSFCVEKGINKKSASLGKDFP